MSRTVCSWCKAPLVLKDDVLVCGNTDCPACDEKYLHEELIRTKKQLETTDLELDQLNLEKYDIEDELDRTRKALEIAIDALDRMAIYDSIYDIIARNAMKRIKELEQKDVK